MSTQSLLSPGYLFDDHDGHVKPAAFLVAGAITLLAPLNWMVPAVSLVALTLLASVALLRALYVILGWRPVLLVPLTFALFTLLAVPGFAWWAAALNSLPMLAAMAVVSMAVGNLGALRQVNLKRLLAYSAIANAGYILVAVVAFNDDGRAAAVFYAVVYAIATLGVFAVVAVISDRLGREAEIDDFRGCWKTNPCLSMALLVFILSLAGIPPLAGFFGKFLLVKSVAAKAFGDAGYFALLAVAVFGVVVSIYYYFGIIRAIYWSKDTSVDSPVSVAWPTRIALGLCVAAILYLGLLPDKPINWANAAAKVGAVAD